MGEEQVHDVVIVGGGVAGINAALELVDVRLDVVVLEAGPRLGGQLAEIPHSIRNVVPSVFPDGPALVSAMERTAGALLAGRVRFGHAVDRAEVAAGWVEAATTRFRGRAILIATGSSPQVHPAAPDGAFGGDVTYHVETRPDRYAGEPVVVVGGGDSATLDALELADTASSVLLVHRSPSLTARRDVIERVRGDSRIVDLPGWELVGLRGGDRLEAAELADRVTGERRLLPAGGVVVKISRDPRTAPFRPQLETDHRGAIVVDGQLRTSVPGVFAAGDVVSGAYWRVAAAIGQGSLAARSVLHHVEAAA
jgi:thioredoxin reductase (NADPH)